MGIEHIRLNSILLVNYLTDTFVHHPIHPPDTCPFEVDQETYSNLCISKAFKKKKNSRAHDTLNKRLNKSNH